MGNPLANYAQVTRLPVFRSGVVGLLALTLALPARAASVDEQLAAVQTEVDFLMKKAAALERHAAPGRGFVTEGQAFQRFEDYLYYFMIGDYELAAEGFFSLVTTAALTDQGLHRDAEWYLAEALFEMGNLETAELQYRVVSEDAVHPFREDAVRRLLEVLALTGRSEEFYAYYEEQVVRGRVRPSDLVRYSVAKAFHQQGDNLKAKSNFLELGPDSVYYHKSRYYMGAILVSEGGVEQAIEYFQGNVEMSVDTLEDRQILDLSLLALGRIYYELGQFEEATDFYDRIGGDSTYLADKLYELVWCFIKQEDYVEALRAIEIFLLGYPEHEYAAHLKVVQGQLHVERIEYDLALTSYEQVIDEYAPVRDEFARLAEVRTDQSELFAAIAAGGSSGYATLPAYAYAMMANDPDLSRALTVYRELERQRETIDASQRLVRELEVVLSSAAAIGGFEMLRYEAVFDHTLALQQQLTLLAIEEQYLDTRADPSVQQQLDTLQVDRELLVERVLSASSQDEERLQIYQTQVASLQRTRIEMVHLVEDLRAEANTIRTLLREGSLTPGQMAQAQADLASVEVDLGAMQQELNALTIEAGGIDRLDPMNLGDAAKIAAEIESLRGSYRTVRNTAKGAADPIGARLESMHGTLVETEGRLIRLLPVLASMEGGELERIRTRFEHERGEVTGQEEGLVALLTEAEDVSVELTRAGFGRLEDFFAESVLKADMGVVDVYWSQKLDVADQREDLVERKMDLMGDLNRRFDLIRQKIGK